MADLADSLKIRQINFPPKLLFFATRKNYHFSPSAKLNSHQNYYFLPSAKKNFGFLQLSSSIYTQSTTAISNKSLKNMKRQRMRDKNSSLFILSLKLVNFNNTFALLLYFFLCQDTSRKMFLSIRQNKFPPKFHEIKTKQKTTTKKTLCYLKTMRENNLGKNRLNKSAPITPTMFCGMMSFLHRCQIRVLIFLHLLYP